MQKYDCPCRLNIVCISEDKGFFHVKSNKSVGDVKGLFKADVDIKGIRFALGLMWYGGNYEIGALVKRDEEYVEVIKIDADDFFDNVDVKDGNVALLSVLPLGNYDVLISAAAYMGGNIFLYASRVINIASVWRDSDIVLPEKHNIHCREVEEVDVTEVNYAKSYKVTNGRYLFDQDKARTELFDLVKKDLKKLGKKPPEDIYDAYAYGTESILYFTKDSVYIDDEDISEVSFEIDKQNIFSNYIFYCWEESVCRRGKCIALNNGNSLLYLPTKTVGQFFITGKDLKGNAATYSLTTEKTISYQMAWADYFLVASDKEDEKIMFNSPSGNLIEYYDFVVPVIPEDKLTNQSEEINSVVGVSKITVYTKV